MQLLIIAIPFVAAAGTLWLLAHLLAPIGYEVSLSRAAGALFLILVCNVVTKLFLGPNIGLAAFAILSLITVKAVLRLSVLRSVVVVIGFCMVWAIAWALVSRH